MTLSKGNRLVKLLDRWNPDTKVLEKTQEPVSAESWREFEVVDLANFSEYNPETKETVSFYMLKVKVLN